MRPAVLAGFLSVGLLCTAGCGGTASTALESVELDDYQKIASLVTEFNDTADYRGMARYFTPDNSIGGTEYKKYIAHTYQVEGKANVTGETATATVKVMKANEGPYVGSKEWAFVKQGNRWKLKSAPLP